jgi:hypothetical protein
MSYQPPDDPYQQIRPPFASYQDRPRHGGQQARQLGEPYYGRSDLQPAQQYGPGYPPDQRAYPAQAAPAAHRVHRQPAGKQYGLRGAEAFWYVLGCIAMGLAYFSKLPGKKAACEVFSELQLDGQGPSYGYSLRGMEGFWYALMCLPFGAGYFVKVSAKKALWELVVMVQAAPGEYANAIGRALSGPAVPARPAY